MKVGRPWTTSSSEYVGVDQRQHPSELATLGAGERNLRAEQSRMTTNCIDSEFARIALKRSRT